MGRGSDAVVEMKGRCTASLIEIDVDRVPVRKLIA
jgi:hypothetical protein